MIYGELNLLTLSLNFEKKLPINQEILRSNTSLRLSFNSTLAPPSKMDNSSAVNVIVASSAVAGHLNRPFSSRLKSNQKPLPSHTNIFIRSRFPLQNTNTALLNKSSLKLFSTITAKPLILFLISVFPQARYIFLPAISIMTASTPVRVKSVCLWDRMHLR